MAGKKNSTAGALIAERRVKKRTSIGHSPHSSYKGKNSVKKRYRGQG